MPKIPREAHGLHSRIAIVEIPKDIGRAMGSAVIGEDDLETQPLGCEARDETPMELGNVALFVQRGDHDGEQHGTCRTSSSVMPLLFRHPLGPADRGLFTFRWRRGAARALWAGAEPRARRVTRSRRRSAIANVLRPGVRRVWPWYPAVLAAAAVFVKPWRRRACDKTSGNARLDRPQSFLFGGACQSS